MRSLVDKGLAPPIRNKDDATVISFWDGFDYLWSRSYLEDKGIDILPTPERLQFSFRVDMNNVCFNDWMIPPHHWSDATGPFMWCTDEDKTALCSGANVIEPPGERSYLKPHALRPPGMPMPALVISDSKSTHLALADATSNISISDTSCEFAVKHATVSTVSLSDPTPPEGTTTTGKPIQYRPNDLRVERSHNKGPHGGDSGGSLLHVSVVW